MRESGILLPVSALPSEYGIGCFSKSAYEWIDFLAKSAQSLWQVLPMSVTSFGDSPYQSCSSFAGNPYFVSLKQLIGEGLLRREECAEAFPGEKKAGREASYISLSRGARVDYARQYRQRYRLLRTAFLRSACGDDPNFRRFEEEEAEWLYDYSLFMALKSMHGGRAWAEWDEKFARKDPAAIEEFKREHADEIRFHACVQYWFYSQWSRLKRYAGSKGIRIVGDIPIYVSYDSVDVWLYPNLFELDKKGRPTKVAGCPPDQFSPGGQLWGNPLYRWEAHREEGYAWWIRRMRHCAKVYDVTRIDHFRGFDEYYSVPAGMRDARVGKWRRGPGIELIDAIRAGANDPELIAEDLGFETERVRVLLERSGYPGMKIIQFAFGGGVRSDHLPQNYGENTVVYTGTHDNETLMQYLEGISEREEEFMRRYLGCPKASKSELADRLIRMAMHSVSKYCIIPMQDYLKLGEEGRMNVPSTLGGNWQWRLAGDELTDGLAESIRELTESAGRFKGDARQARLTRS